jgi:hypothetical protein
MDDCHHGAILRAVRVCLLLLGAGFALASNLAFRAASGTGAVRRHQISYFYQSGCPECAKVTALVEQYGRRHAELGLKRVDMKWLANVELRLAYDDAYRVPEARRLEAPALFVENHAYIGVDAIRLTAKQDQTEADNGNRWQDAADRYGPGVLRALLALALFGAAISCWTGAALRAGIGRGIQLFLGSVLLVAAASKIIHIGQVAEMVSAQWHVTTLSASGLTGTAAAAELLVGIVLLAGRPRALVAKAPPILFSGFLLYTLATQFLSVSGDCGCFPWRENLGWATVVRNLGFAALAFVASGPLSRSRLQARSEGLAALAAE